MWNKVFTKTDIVVYRKIAGEMLLVPIRGNVADMQKLFALNPSAEYIWERLDGEKRLQEIRDELIEDFAVEPDQVETDILEFIHELRQAALISEVS